MLSPEDNENIKKIYQNLLNLLSEETVDKYLLNKIDEIIVSLIKFVFDLDYFQEVLFDSEIILLEPESIHYSVEVMRNVLVCLQVFFFRITLDCITICINVVGKSTKRTASDVLLH